MIWFFENDEKVGGCKSKENFLLKGFLYDVLYFWVWEKYDFV